jgi:hypothetical protein
MATGRVPTTANSPLTAKGDLFGYSTTQARVAVGNDGETLVADSAATTGLRYQAPVNANPVLNSAFQVWQRGTSGSATSGAGTYVADRWSGLLIGATPTNTITRQSTNDTTNLPFIQYCARYQRTAGQTATGTMYLTQSLETVNSIPYVGKTVTISFYARAGANYSSTSNALVVNLSSGTGTDQNINSGFTGQTSIISQTSTLTTTWQRFSYTGTVGVSATQLGLFTSYSPTGTAGANDYYEVTGFQLEVGSVATPFKTYAGTLQGELAACQRYYFRISGNASAVNTAIGWLNPYSTTQAVGQIKNPITMRTIPYSIEFSTLVAAAPGVASAAISTLTFNTASTGPDITSILITTASGLVAYRMCDLLTSTSAGYLGISAEL